MESKHAHRKNEHVSLAEKFYQANSQGQFDDVRFIHQSLPEIALSEISLETHLGSLQFETPFFINAMTGGSAQTGDYNAALAELAAKHHLAIAAGSESIALSDSVAEASFKVLREKNPDGIIFANLGAGHSVEDAKRAIDLIQADAIEIHVNTPQELVMPEGDRDFHWLASIEALVKALSVPVIVKEVGFGMSRETIEQLMSVGVQNIDIGGRGGTNFVQIENFRRSDKSLDYLSNWGQTTVESMLEAQDYLANLNVVATGGIRNPLDIALSLGLGASLVGVSGQILHSLIQTGFEGANKMLQEWTYGLQVIMTMLGTKTVKELAKAPMILEAPLVNYLNQRNLTFEQR